MYKYLPVHSEHITSNANVGVPTWWLMVGGGGGWWAVARWWWVCF